MSPAIETRLNINVIAIFTTYEAMKSVGHILCPWVKALVRYHEWILAIMVNFMLFACLGAKI